MDMDKNEVFSRLLCYGLFPERLMNVFTSEVFGSWVLANNQHIDISPQDRFSLLSYKLTRNNNSPRFLGVPHPLGYISLCRTIHENWEEIENKLGNVPNYENISMIIPKLSNKNKRLISMASYDQHHEKEKLQLDKQFGKKYFVKADVSDFYPSIYTHAIPWVLVGKDEAKAHSKREHRNLWYNKLDTAMRNIQDGESKGIPIGPDTSGLIAELVLSSIDQTLQKYEYIRFIDDYNCYCETKERAEKFIRELSFCLEEYRLKLNTKKTKILELPQALTHDWVRKLKQFIEWDEINKKDKNKVLSFLDLSSDLFRKNPEESSIRYAAKALSSKKYSDYSTYAVILRYFLNLCFLYPYVIDICDEFSKIGIDSFRARESDIKNTLCNSLEKMLKEHVKHHRSDVITWSLFLAIKYNLKLSNYDEIAIDILNTQDCIPALMAFLYTKINKGKVDNFTKLLRKIDQNEWWLYAYEISRAEGIALKDSEMEKLRKKNISFLGQEIEQRL